MKKAFSLLVTAVLLGIVLSGCATTVPVRALKVPKINLSEYRNMAIMDPYLLFRFNGESPYGSFNVDLGEKNNEQLISTSIRNHFLNYIFDQMNYSEQGIAFLKMDPAGKLVDMIVDQLKETGYFTIYKPDSFIWKSTAADYANKPFQKLAENTDIKAFLLPYALCNLEIEYDYSGSHWGTEVKITSKLSVKFGYKIFDSKGRMIVDKRFFGDCVYDHLDASIKLMQAEMFLKVMEKQVPAMTAQIAPKKIIKYSSLSTDKTKNPLMKEAEKLVKLKQYTQAKDLYIQIFNDTKNPAAAINAGIMFQALEDLKNGLEWLKKTNEALHDKMLSKEIGLMEADLEQQNLIYQ